MSTESEKLGGSPGKKAQTGRTRRFRGSLILVMGSLALIVPFVAGSMALLLVGLLLIVCGVLEMLETIRAADETRRRTAYVSGILSVLCGIALLAQPQLIVRGLSLFLAASFLIDGLGKLIAAVRSQGHATSRSGLLAAALLNLALAAVLVFRWPISGLATVAILVGLHMLAAGWAMLLGREPLPERALAQQAESMHPDRSLNLPPHAEFATLLEVQQTAA